YCSGRSVARGNSGERGYPLCASDRTLARLACFEAISDPGLSFNQTRFRWIGFDLLPQMCDVNPKILSMIFRFRAPDLAEDVSMGEDPSGMPNEQSKQRILGGGELYLVTAACHHPSCKIDNQIAAFKNGNLSFESRFALSGAKTREKFRRAERFGDVIFSAGIERGDLALFIIAHGKNDYGR